MKNTVLSVICLLCTLTVQSQSLYFKHLGIADGLSQVRTQAIYQDETGAIWISTAEGLNRYNGSSVSTYTPSDTTNFPTNGIEQLCGNKNGQLYLLSQGKVARFDLYREKFSLISGKDVRSIFCEKDTLWMACKDGIYCYTEKEKNTSLFFRFPKTLLQASRLYAGNDTIWALNSTYLTAIPRKNPSQWKKLFTFHRGNTQCLFVDKRQNIWVGSWSGVYRLSPSRKTSHYTSQTGEVSDNQIRCILEDDAGDIWFGTFKGLDCYHPKSDTWSHYTEYGDSPNTLSHSSILALYKDRDGNIWAGTYFGGVNVFNPDRENNHFYYAAPLRKDWLNFPVVGKIAEDLTGNLWICTEGGGLNKLDANTGKFSHYVHRKGDPQSIGSNNLKSIYFHPETEKLYVGTHFGGLYILDTRTGKGHTLRHVSGDPSSLPHDIVNQIQPYKEGLLILTQGGLAYMDPETEKFSKVSMNREINKLLAKYFTYETFLLDKRNRLWLGLSRGGVICADLTTSHISQYLDAPFTPGEVSHIFEDRYGDIYIGTAGSGLLRYQKKEDAFKQYSTYDGTLSSNFCYYIGEAKQNNCLYLIHGKGISLFNTQTESIENTYRLFDQSYSLGSAMFRDRKGTLYIGGTNGLAVLRKENTEIASPTPHFDRLSIFNREICPGDGSGILSDILGKTREIRLKHDQNNVTVEITDFRYLEDIHPSFEYTLEGFDESWNHVQGSKITYTNLSPGHYTLKVRPIAGDSQTEEAALDIRVTPPFYASAWAYVLYACIAGGILFVILSFIIHQTRLYASLNLAKKEKKHIEEMNRMKIDFFTNVSHEFKTPLTLILGQLETLIQSDNVSNPIHNKLLRIYKNAAGMRRLISELMDFHTQERGRIKLKAEGMDFVEFMRQTCQPFTEYARQKDIGFRFNALTDHFTVWLDPIQMQKVVSNLLLNALKYTPSKGYITVEVRKTKDMGIVTVADTGKGISKEDLKRIFNPFFQTGDAQKGIGIGLSIAKEIVDLHHGSIQVDSRQGEGSQFTVSLPLGQSHFSQEELKQEEDFVFLPQEQLPLPLADEEENEDGEVFPADEDTEEGKPLLLLVEDNKELCTILKEAFSPSFQLHVVHDGQEGWEKAQQLHPDMVICDVVVSGIPGKELCYKIKNNVELADVSVILVSAQTSSDQEIEAYRFGADDYIVKPFDISILLTRCHNLLKNRGRLMAFYTDKAVPETTAEEAISDADRKIMQKAIDIIRANFTNPKFDVTELANSLAMGRSKLYTKFKQVAGLPPNEFILKIKLEEGMLMLKDHPELNISEISQKLGFSSPRYFTKQFKAFFGITPQNMRSKKEE